MAYRFPSQVFMIGPSLEKEINTHSLSAMIELDELDCNHLEESPPYPVENQITGTYQGIWFTSQRLDVVIGDNNEARIIIPGFNSDGDHCVDFLLLVLPPAFFNEGYIVPLPAFSEPAFA